ncbi:unnamed protein product, partial [Phaeothamnion confervicola]
DGPEGLLEAYTFAAAAGSGQLAVELQHSAPLALIAVAKEGSGGGSDGGLLTAAAAEFAVAVEVIILPVAQPPLLAVGELSVLVAEDQEATVFVSAAALNDSDDGQETLRIELRMEGGARLDWAAHDGVAASASVNPATGEWVYVLPAGLAAAGGGAVTLRPATDWSGRLAFQVVAVATEDLRAYEDKAPSLLLASASAAAVAEAALSVELWVVGVADPALLVLDTSAVEGVEDVVLSLNVTELGLVDVDGSEMVRLEVRAEGPLFSEVTFGGVSLAESAGGGSSATAVVYEALWSGVTAASSGTLRVLPVPNWSGNTTLSVVVATREAGANFSLTELAGGAPWVSQSAAEAVAVLDVRVVAVADVPELFAWPLHAVAQQGAPVAVEVNASTPDASEYIALEMWVVEPAAALASVSFGGSEAQAEAGAGGADGMTVYRLAGGAAAPAAQLNGTLLLEPSSDFAGPLAVRLVVRSHDGASTAESFVDASLWMTADAAAGAPVLVLGGMDRLVLEDTGVPALLDVEELALVGVGGGGGGNASSELLELRLWTASEGVAEVLAFPGSGDAPGEPFLLEVRPGFGGGGALRTYRAPESLLAAGFGTVAVYPKLDFSGDMRLHIVAAAYDATGAAGAVGNGSAETEPVTWSIVVAPVADVPTLAVERTTVFGVSGGSGPVLSWYGLNGTDSDGSEAVTLQVRSAVGVLKRLEMVGGGDGGLAERLLDDGPEGLLEAYTFAAAAGSGQLAVELQHSA